MYVCHESVYVTITTTGIDIHKLLGFANHFMSHLFSVISLLLNANIKNDGNYIIFFKVKNHLVQLNRT